MTREEAIARVKHQRDWANEVNRTLDVEAFDMATKALEQEPFKPMVEIDLYSVIKQKYIESEVLDKIRAEIDGLTYYWYEVHPRDVIDDVLEIIDKYKAESEGEE